MTATDAITTPTNPHVRAGVGSVTVVWIAGGLLWAAAGLAGIGAAEGSARFVASIAIFLVAQVVLLVGLVALRRADPWGRRRLGSVGWGVAVAGRVAFVVAEVASLATGELAEAIYPIGAILTALGMIGVGIGVLRARRWSGIGRFAPLAFGAYPFAAMFPIVAAGGSPDVAIALWGLLAATVGLAAGATADEPA